MQKWVWWLCLIPILNAGTIDWWTWKDAAGQDKRQADLYQILQAHKRWLETDGKVGQRADLGRVANYNNPLSISYKNVNLSGADLAGADLRKANLRGVDLSGANLGETNNEFGHLLASPRAADLTGADLTEANLTGADLTGVRFGCADLPEADLNSDNNDGSISLSQPARTTTHRRCTDLTGASLTRANLSKAELTGAVYEPKENPDPKNIANAEGLGYLDWYVDSRPLYTLRKSLLDAGFRDAARQVTASIRRHRQSVLERLVFDWTCEWGANWLRPLKLATVLCLICTVIYWAGIHFGTRNGLYLVTTGERIPTSKGRERTFRIAAYSQQPIPWTDQLDLGFTLEPRFKPSAASLGRVLGREFTALGTVFLFSLMSIFNIGFREFNFGRWIRMLQRREFDIRARGWLRCVSGIQSLLGVALIALSLLSYFGQPFD